MVSLKMTPAEAKAEGYGAPAEAPAPEYPWGTTLSVIDGTAEALFPAMPEVGKPVKIAGMAIVTSVNITKREGKDRFCVELQVTDLEVEAAEAKKGAAESIYGKDGPKKSED